ncbi:MAG: hypothetical protein ACOZEN_08970 [Thermodesulfobacteriota bacterium]
MDTAPLVALIMSGLLTVVVAAGGFIIRSLYESVKALHERCAAQEKAMAEQAQRTAENYLRREDCFRQSDAVLERLGKIESKLDRALERMGNKA